jgi:DNA-binding MarR family transcriptional regulator
VRNLKEELMNEWLELTKKQTQIAEQLEHNLAASDALTLNEYYVLYFLAKTPKGSLRLNDLLDHIHLSQSAMSRMITRMENKKCGVIDRHVCHDDKRGVYIDITEKGREKLRNSDQVVMDTLKNMLK